MVQGKHRGWDCFPGHKRLPSPREYLWKQLPPVSGAISQMPSKHSSKDFPSAKIKVTFFLVFAGKVLEFFPQKETEEWFCCGSGTRDDDDDLLFAASWMQTAPRDKKWKQERHFHSGF